MKILEFNMRIKKIMKIREPQWRITKIMKNLEVNVRIMQIMKILKFLCENQEDHENHEIPLENHKKYENT